jgi:3-isopropylmalate dehydrogenase
MSMAKKIAVLPGDGIGPEIMAEAVAVLSQTAEKYHIDLQLDEYLVGGSSYEAYGEPLTDSVIESCKGSDAVLLGAVGGPKWDELPMQLRPEKALLGLRSSLGLYTNLRPAVLHRQLAAASPLKDEILAGGIDIMIVRELTGGIYFGPRGSNEQEAFDTEIYSVPEIERIVQKGFEMAQKRQKKLTLVDKANILDSSRLWRRVVQAMAKEHPDISMDYLYVDNAAMQLIINPGRFDVIVTSNMFGDILSDEASVLTGSIGMLPSASLADGNFGMYEPVHGSAPDLAGQEVANPLAAILSAAMLLRHSLGQDEAAAAIEQAVSAVLDAGLRTADLYDGSANTTLVGTKAMGQAVRNLL